MLTYPGTSSRVSLLFVHKYFWKGEELLDLPTPRPVSVCSQQSSQSDSCGKASTQDLSLFQGPALCPFHSTLASVAAPWRRKVWVRVSPATAPELRLQPTLPPLQGRQRSAPHLFLAVTSPLPAPGGREPPSLHLHAPSRLIRRFIFCHAFYFRACDTIYFLSALLCIVLLALP